MAAYVLENVKWKNGQTITWHFSTAGSPAADSDFSSYMAKGAFEEAVRAALAKWSTVANINFQEVSSDSDADINFGYQNLQGTGSAANTYVAAQQGDDGTFYFQPNIAVAFQDPSTSNVYNGNLSYYHVALHEIGHALGLAHDDDPSSIMDPSATGSNNDLNLTDIAGLQALYGPRSTNIHVTDNDTGNDVYLPGDTFDGPTGIPVDIQFIVGSTTGENTADIISHNLNIYTTKPSFIHTGSGRDFISAEGSYGQNIMDGGTNTNFIKGSSASGSSNIGYADDRVVGSSDTWTTFAGFHAGDEALLWGLQSNNWSSMRFYDNSGAAGYTGLTIALDHNGHTDTITVSGYSVADLSNGKISVSFGHTADTNGLSGSDYMELKLNG